MKRGEAWRISWVDSAATHGWRAPGEVHAHASRCESVGYFVQETKGALTFAQNRGLENGMIEFGEYMTIPKCAVTAKRRLK